MIQARAIVAGACLVAATVVQAADPEAEARISGTFNASYYALPDEPDFTVGVAVLERDALHLEARYNYEARNAGSLFAGWKFAGGDALSWQVTPLLGALVAKGAAVIPGVEASAAYRSFDLYVEAEYVADQRSHAESYFYAWSELGWRPAERLRLGVVGQHTHAVHTDRDLQRGVFAQVTLGGTTLGIYAFNPDSGSRYAIVSIAFAF